MNFVAQTYLCFARLLLTQFKCYNLFYFGDMIMISMPFLMPSIYVTILKIVIFCIEYKLVNSR